MKARVLLAMVLCASCRQSPGPTTSLRFAPAAESPKFARVVVDDQAIGSLELVAKRGVALPPGKHRITIEAAGYLPWDQEVDAGDNGGLIKLDVQLVKRPD